jgi:short-subunit dehydrogenase
VGRAADVEAAAADIEARWGGVDVVINNAGVAAAGPVGEMSLDDWRWIVDINMWGVVHGCHSFVPRLKKQKSGFILNVASSAGFASLPEMGAYSLTKAAVISLSETLRGELARDGISVSVLCPTFVKTNLLETARTSSRALEMAHKAFEKSLMTADQVARVALKGLQAGELIIIPQLDGAVLWRAKRLSPGGFQKLLGFGYRLAGR